VAKNLNETLHVLSEEVRYLILVCFYIKRMIMSVRVFHLRNNWKGFSEMWFLLLYSESCWESLMLVRFGPHFSIVYMELYQTSSVLS